MRRQAHSAIHLRRSHHALVHHRCLRHSRVARAAMAHPVRSRIAHDRSRMRDRRRPLGHLWCSMPALSLLAPRRCHRMAHDVRVSLLQSRRRSRWATGSTLGRRRDTHRDSPLRHHRISNHGRRDVEWCLVANHRRRLLPLADAVRLREAILLLLSSKLRLCLLRRELLPSSFFSGVFLGLSLFQSPASFSLHLLLVSFGHLLLDLDLVLPLRLLLMLHTDILQCLESGEARLEWCTAASFINSGFRCSRTVRNTRLQSLIHDEHESLFLSRQGFVGFKLSHGALASLR